MTQLFLFLRASTTGLWRGVTRPLPRPTWTRRQAIAVQTVRAFLEQLQGRSGAEQQQLLTFPRRPLPRDLDTYEAPLAGRDALWLVPPQGFTTTWLHFHGGGYVIGHPSDALPYLSRVARMAGVRVISLDYRLAPQHPFPAALDDACAAVQALLDEGTPPEALFLGGDSAGGGLALATLLRLRDEGLPKTAGAVLGSPWLDLNPEGHSDQSASPSADFLAPGTADTWRQLYLGDTDPQTPLVSPGRCSLHDLPPLLFLAGQAEALAPQISRAAQSATSAGVETELIVGTDAVHTWYMLPGLLPGPDILPSIVAFLDR